MSLKLNFVAMVEAQTCLKLFTRLGVAVVRHGAPQVLGIKIKLERTPVRVYTRGATEQANNQQQPVFNQFSNSVRKYSKFVIFSLIADHVVLVHFVYQTQRDGVQH